MQTNHQTTALALKGESERSALLCVVLPLISILTSVFFIRACDECSLSKIRHFHIVICRGVLSLVCLRQTISVTVLVILQLSDKTTVEKKATRLESITSYVVAACMLKKKEFKFLFTPQSRSHAACLFTVLHFHFPTPWWFFHKVQAFLVFTAIEQQYIWRILFLLPAQFSPGWKLHEYPLKSKHKYSQQHMETQAGHKLLLLSWAMFWFWWRLRVLMFK